MILEELALKVSTLAMKPALTFSEVALQSAKSNYFLFFVSIISIVSCRN
jgi:hypothetical protein